MRGIELLHPELQTIAKQFEANCKSAGLNVLITETWRSTAEQNALYAQGRTTSGNIVTNCKGDSYQSPHQWGCAFDFCRNEKGREYVDSDNFFSKCGEVGKKLGLFWGGNFKSPDKPHLEYPKYIINNSTSTLKNQYTTPEKFKATWNNTSQGIQENKEESGFEMKVYQNGATMESVFQDSSCRIKIGVLGKYEVCDCLGIKNNMAIVGYKINGTNDYKVGMVKWLGGIK